MTVSSENALPEEAIAGLVRRDQAHLIHPQYYAPEHQDPVIFDHGEGVWLVDVRGRRYKIGRASCRERV